MKTPKKNYSYPYTNAKVYNPFYEKIKNISKEKKQNVQVVTNELIEEALKNRENKALTA